MSLPRPIRVVGCGSAVGDDALAWEVVRRLRACMPVQDEVELHVANGGHQLLDALDGRGTLVLIDAVSSGAPPGTIHRFEWPHVRLQIVRPGSSHGVGPANALQLAAALGVLPPRVVVFGIEVESLDLTLGLSVAVRAAVPKVVRRILEELAADLSCDARHE